MHRRPDASVMMKRATWCVTVIMKRGTQRMQQIMRSRLDVVLPLTVSLTATSVFFINFCAAIFRCGCRALWAGADTACNIHASHGHHCPWCAHGTAGYTAVMVLLCLPQLAVSLSPGWGRLTKTLVALALFPAMGLVIALAFGWYDGYWR
jgi:hypothetical protein